MQEISGMIKMNYEKYKHQILEREPINNRIEIYATFAIIAFLVIITCVKVCYLNKVVKFMKTRKLIWFVKLWVYLIVKRYFKYQLLNGPILSLK